MVLRSVNLPDLIPKNHNIAFSVCRSLLAKLHRTYINRITADIIIAATQILVNQKIAPGIDTRIITLM